MSPAAHWLSAILCTPVEDDPCSHGWVLVDHGLARLRPVAKIGGGGWVEPVDPVPPSVRTILDQHRPGRNALLDHIEWRDTHAPPILGGDR